MTNYNIVEYEEELTEVLANNYADIYNELVKEDYIIEYNSFVEFRELIFNDKIVGFLTMDTFIPDPESLCLTECYILKQYRGKGILIDLIKELLQDENIVLYIRRPNYTFIKFLLKHDLAMEVAPDLVTSHIKFVIKGSEVYINKNIKKLYRRLNSRSLNFFFYGAAYNMKLCSIFFSDNAGMVSKKRNVITFSTPRDDDLKKHDCNNELNKLTFDKMDEILYDYAINNDEIEIFNKKLSAKLHEKNEDRLVYTIDGEVFVNKNLKPNDLLRVKEVVKRELMERNLTFRSADTRFEYLLKNPEKIDDTVDLSLIEPSDNEIFCPFCGDKCHKGDKTCKTCGQKVKSLFTKKRFSLRNIF